MEAIIQDVIEYINDAVRCAMMDPAATLLVFMLLVLIIITPGRKAAGTAGGGEPAGSTEPGIRPGI